MQIGDTVITTHSEQFPPYLRSRGKVVEFYEHMVLINMRGALHWYNRENWMVE